MKILIARVTKKLFREEKFLIVVSYSDSLKILNVDFFHFQGYYSELHPPIKALSILLKRFIQALVPCCKSLLKQGYEKVLRRTVAFTRMSGFLLLSVPGVILREFLVLLTMAQNFAPAVASTSEGVPLLGELLDNLDMFNHSNKNWQVDDDEDLSWSTEGKAEFYSHLVCCLHAT